MKKIILTLTLVVAGCLIWFIGVPVFKNSALENRLLVKTISCRIKGCTQIEADFHDYGGMKKVPSFISIARKLERMMQYILELEEISALSQLKSLKEVNVQGVEGNSALAQQLKDQGVTVLWK